MTVKHKKHLHCRGKYDQVPPHQKNPHILNWYRMNFETHVDCLKSLFMVHNESINIWTHLLGTVYFIVDMIVFVSSECTLDSVGDAFILFCYVSCILCLSSSTWFHVNCCLPCPNHFACLLKYDMAGILTVILALYLTGVCLVFSGPNYVLQSLYLAYAIIAGIVASLPLTVSHLSAWSRSALVFFGLSASVPVSHFMAIATPDEVRIFLPPVIMFTVFFISGVAFFFTRIPERHAPGRFDLFLHSHQIWHVLVFCGLQSALEGMKRLHRARVTHIYI